MLDYFNEQPMGGSASVETRYGLQVDKHRYIAVDGTDVVADPAWKQFVPEELRRPELTDVLIGSRDYVAEFAAENGVSEANQLLWLPVGQSLQPECPISVAEKIAQAYDASY